MDSRHGSLESSILNTLWELEQKNIYKNSVKDVFNILAQKKDAKRAYTTIKTVMDRLVDKNILLRFKQDKKFFYRTAYSNDEIILNSLTILANRYCNGNFEKITKIINDVNGKNKNIKYINV